MALSIGFRVSVSLHLLSKLRGVWLLPRRDSHPLVAPAFLWTRDHLIRPHQQQRRDGETEGGFLTQRDFRRAMPPRRGGLGADAFCEDGDPPGGGDPQP